MCAAQKMTPPFQGRGGRVRGGLRQVAHVCLDLKLIPPLSLTDARITAGVLPSPGFLLVLLLWVRVLLCSPGWPPTVAILLPQLLQS